MKTHRLVKGFTLGLFLVMMMSSRVLAGTQFTSHVSVNTPARSFSHGVGDPVSTMARRSYLRKAPYKTVRRPSYSQSGGGYPRVRPKIPFNDEDFRRGHSFGTSSWNYNSFMEMPIAVLPPSPYKVDSSDPESLWPEGLFLPPINAPRFGHSISRADNRFSSSTETEPLDPYLLEGSEAIAAVANADLHGELFFHEIPHIESLLANQEQRTKNKLKPHRLGSIRHTWPFNRP